MTIASTVSEVEKFYQEYIRSFNEDDFKSYCTCFAPGSITVKSGSQVISGTVDEISARASALRKRLKSEGWQNTRVRNQRIWAVEERLALIAADLERINNRGEIYEVARCIYSVVKADDGWKIWNMVVSTDALSSSDGLVDVGSSRIPN